MWGFQPHPQRAIGGHGRIVVGHVPTRYEVSICNDDDAMSKARSCCSSVYSSHSTSCSVVKSGVHVHVICEPLRTSPFQVRLPDSVAIRAPGAVVACVTLVERVPRLTVQGALVGVGGEGQATGLLVGVAVVVVALVGRHDHVVGHDRRVGDRPRDDARGDDGDDGEHLADGGVGGEHPQQGRGDGADERGDGFQVGQRVGLAGHRGDVGTRGGDGLVGVHERYSLVSGNGCHFLGATVVWTIWRVGETLAMPGEAVRTMVSVTFTGAFFPTSVWTKRPLLTYSNFSGVKTERMILFSFARSASS